MALTAIQAYVLKELNKGVEISPSHIQMLVRDFIPTASHKLSLYDRYSVKRVPIQFRVPLDGTKVNNKINNDFAGEIVDTKIGYVLGNPIKYSVDRNSYEGIEAKFKEHQGQVNKFVVSNKMNDKDIELGKLVSICGVAGREIYIDKNGNEKVVNLKPWETIFLTNAEGDVEYALRQYSELFQVGDKLEELICVDFYDNEKITSFIERKAEDGSMSFVYDDSKENPRYHVFGITPIIKVVNNEEELGDFERVMSQIDAYDRTTSDVNSEIEQFRMAYMKFTGVKVTPELIEQSKQAGGFEIPDGADISFITKNINDVVVENHLKRLEADINRFAKHVNMSDPNFGGGDSSLANKYKLTALEMKSIILEVKMKTALLRQFQIISSAWAKKGVVVDYLNIFFEFSRNLPVNIMEEATETEKLKGLVSERTRLGKLSFVDDIDYEIEQMESDSERLGMNLPNEASVEERYNLNAFDSEEGNVDGEQ